MTRRGQYSRARQREQYMEIQARPLMVLAGMCDMRACWATSYHAFPTGALCLEGSSGR
jgi:hypothetical protein